MVLSGTALGLLLVAALVWLLLITRRDPLGAMLRQRGYPTSLAEANAWYPAVPDAENAALVYTNAFAHLTNSTATVTNFLLRNWLPPLGEGFTTQEKAELASVLEANAEALRLLHSVPASARSRYPIDLREGYALALPYLAEARWAVLLLASEALAQAGDGDAEGATRTFLAAGRVAESLAEEPLVISQKVRSMTWNTLLARLERALTLTSFTDRQLAALQEQVQAAERPRAALRGWVGELVAGKTLFQDRRIMDSAFIGNSLVAPRTTVSQLGRMNPLARRGCMTLLRIAGQQGKDEEFYLDYVGKRVAAMELPYPARFAAMHRLDGITNAPGRWCVFSQVLITLRPLLDCQDADHTARVRVAATVLAIERFRLAHGGTLPESLAELAPRWIEKLPLDPFDGRPLHYQKNGASYVVYSVGSNCQDDGGVAWDNSLRKAPQDVAIVVKR